MKTKRRARRPSCAASTDDLPPLHGRAWSEIASELLMSDRFAVRNGDSWADLELAEAQLSRLESEKAKLDPGQRRALAEVVTQRNERPPYVDHLRRAGESCVGVATRENKGRNRMNQTRTRPATSARPTCVQPGCKRVPTGRLPVRADLRYYCGQHRRLRGRTELPPPDHNGAARLAQAKEPRNVEVGPPLALALLALSGGNRSLDERHVERYVRDMQDRAWWLNDQGIGLGSDGTLLNGHHRLWAIAISGVTVRLLVQPNLDPKARETMDAGRLRSVGDQLDMTDGGSSGRTRSAWAGVIDKLERGTTGPISANRTRAQLSRFAHSVDWMLQQRLPRSSLSKAAVLGAFVYVHAVDPALAERAITAYRDGAELKKGSALLLLRDGIMNKEWMGEPPRRIGLIALTALWAESSGVVLEKLTSEESALEFFQGQHALREMPVDRA